MVDKIRPNAMKYWNDGNDGRDGRWDIQYYCPKCCKTLRENDIACDTCGTFFDWSKKAKIKIIYDIEWV